MSRSDRVIKHRIPPAWDSLGRLGRRSANKLRMYSHVGRFGARPPVAARRDALVTGCAPKLSFSLVDLAGTQVYATVPKTVNECHAAVVPEARPDCRNSGPGCVGAVLALLLGWTPLVVTLAG